VPATGDEAERLWRRLYTEFAVLLDLHYTDQQVVDLFYEYGVIDAPTVPAGMKSVRDYVVETFHNGHAIPGFLRAAVPRVVFELDMEEVSVDAIRAPMEGLGYELEAAAAKANVASYRPPKRLPRRPTPPYRPPKGANGQVVVPGLTGELRDLVNELNDCLDRQNRNAAALLTRKIISQALFVAMAKRGREGELRKDNGDDLDLSAALRKCKEVCEVSGQVMGRVTSAKWIGDTANHSYRVKVTDEDLERAVTGMTLFLREIFAGL
jgi:hypothetical protein